LKRPEAIEVAERSSAAASDVVVENFAAGVMEAHGPRWECSAGGAPISS